MSADGQTSGELSGQEASKSESSPNRSRCQNPRQTRAVHEVSYETKLTAFRDCVRILKSVHAARFCAVDLSKPSTYEPTA